MKSLKDFAARKPRPVPRLTQCDEALLPRFFLGCSLLLRRLCPGNPLSLSLSYSLRRLFFLAFGPLTRQPRLVAPHVVQNGAGVCPAQARRHGGFSLFTSQCLPAQKKQEPDCLIPVLQFSTGWILIEKVPHWCSCQGELVEDRHAFIVGKLQPGKRISWTSRCSVTAHFA